MTEPEPPSETPPEPPSEKVAKPARPSGPTLGPRTPTDARPIRPSRERSAPAAVAEPVVAPPPPPPPRRVARPSAFAAVGLRKTLIPPCFVLGVGCVALGAAYFRQPPDAALRQIAVALPTALLAAGGVAITCAAALAWSVRRH